MEEQKKFLLLRAAFIVIALKDYPEIVQSESGDDENGCYERLPGKDEWPIGIDKVSIKDGHLILLEDKELTQSIDGWFADGNFDVNKIQVTNFEDLCNKLNKLTQINLGFIKARWITHEAFELIRYKLSKVIKN